MANKPFEIQSSTLTIGGVDLQAGSNGVVIPGLTRAATFVPKEVEKFTDDESIWQDPPVLIDSYLWSVLMGGTPAQGWTSPTYSAQLDDEGKIDEINIDSVGAGIIDQIKTVMSDNMYAAPDGTSIDPQTFDSQLWVTIPWTVKCEAGEVESIGGGGGTGVVEREITVPAGSSGDTRGTLALTPGGSLFVCTADYVNVGDYGGTYEVETSQDQDIGQSGGTYNAINILAADYSEIAYIFNNTPAGQTPGNWLIDAGPDYGGLQACTMLGNAFNATLTFYWPHRAGVDPEIIEQGYVAEVIWDGPNIQQPAIWKQTDIGDLQLVNGYMTRTRYQGGESSLDLERDDVQLEVNHDDNSIAKIRLNNTDTDATYVAVIVSPATQNTPPDYGSIWKFKHDGSLQFPDGSLQTTAYTGSETTSRTYVISEDVNSFNSITTPTSAIIDGMSYAGGEVVSDGAFGPGSSRVAVYAESMFAMIATNSTATDIYYNGETGSDGDGTKTITTNLLSNYSGYYASASLLKGDDPAISQIVISKGDSHSTEYHWNPDNTDNDDFHVGGLAQGTVVVLNVYWSATGGPDYTSSITLAAREFIDNVIFDGNTERTDIAAMKTAFYANASSMRNNIENDEGDYLYDGFEFFGGNQVVRPTGGSGSNALLEIRAFFGGDYGSPTIVSGGTGYTVNDTLTVPGTEFGGTSPANDVTITVNAVVNGVITEFDANGTVPTQVWPQSSINDGDDDQYDTGNVIGTNFTRVTATVTVAQAPEGFNSNETLTVITADKDITPGQWVWVTGENTGTLIIWANSYGVNNTAEYFDSDTGYTSTLDLTYDFKVDVDDAHLDINGDGTWEIGSNAFDTKIYSTNEIGPNPKDIIVQADNNSWMFDRNGNLTLPTGGDIFDSNGNSVLSSADANIWVQTFVSDAPATDFPQMATSVEYDNDGNVIALFSHGQTDFGIENDGRYFSVGKYDADGTKIWTVRFAADLNTDGWGLAVDNADGWIYIAGSTGGNNLPHPVSTLTKIDSGNGSIEWSKLYDFGYESSSAVVDVDSDGNPIMVGYVDLAPEYYIQESYLTITKVNQSNGNVTWSRKLDGQADEKAYGMGVGPSGEVVAVGYMDTFGVQDAAATLYTDTVSNPNWTTGTGIVYGGLTARVDFTDGVPTFTNIVDTAGNRTVDGTIGTFSGAGFGGTSPADDMIIKVGTLAANDTDDRMVVVKYATDGTIAWQKAIQFDEGWSCSGADADIDSQGNIYICGTYTFEFNGGPGTGNGIGIVKLDSSGVKQWSRRVVGDCISLSTSIVVGPDDKLYISGVNGSDITATFTWVVAKYSLDGLVEWQRFVENTENWTFGGSFFNGEGGGSNIAVRQGYVALAGGFGNLYLSQQPHAAVVQVSSTGNEFTLDTWDFRAANFSGTLNPTASDITVVNAGLTDSDNASAIQPDSISLGTDNSNFLIGTVFTSATSDADLVGDGYQASTGSKTKIYTNHMGYQGGEELSLVISDPGGPIRQEYPVGSTVTFRNGEVRTITNISDWGSGNTEINWNGVVEGSIGDNAGSNPRYPVTLKTSNYADDVKRTARIKPDLSEATANNQYMKVYAGAIVPPPATASVMDSLHIHMAGGQENVELFLGTDANYVSTKEAGDTPAGVRLHSEVDVAVVNSNLRLDRKGSTWISVYGEGENRNIHDAPAELSFSTIAIDDHGDYYVGGEAQNWSEAFISKYSRDGNLLWSKYNNGDIYNGWQFDGVAYHDGQVATLVQTNSGRDHDYYKLTVHNSDTGAVISTSDIYDTDGDLFAHSMIYHSTEGWTVVGESRGEIGSTGDISSTNGGVDIIRLPAASCKINGLYPASNQNWYITGTNVSGTQSLGEGVGVFANTTITAVTGTGNGATVDVKINYNTMTYSWLSFGIAGVGSGYVDGDQLKILGSALGGVDGGFLISADPFTWGNGKIYFSKSTYPTLNTTLNAVSGGAFVRLNTGVTGRVTAVTDDNAGSWAVAITVAENELAAAGTVNFFTGNDITFTASVQSDILVDLLNLTGIPNRQNITINMDYAMGYMDVDFTSGTFALTKPLDNRPWIWTSDWTRYLNPVPDTNNVNAGGTAFCVAEDPRTQHLVVGGRIDNPNNNGNSFVWKLTSGGATTWAKTIDNDGDTVFGVAVSELDSSIYATTSYNSVNKISAIGDLLYRAEPSGNWNIYVPEVKLAVEEDGIEYVYVGGAGYGIWGGQDGFYLSKLTTDFKPVWGRSMWHFDDSFDVDYDETHTKFVLGKGQASLVGYGYMYSSDNPNALIYTISTQDQFTPVDIQPGWKTAQDANHVWALEGGFSMFNLITAGAEGVQGSAIDAADQSSLAWTNYTFQSRLINLNGTKSGIVGVETIDFADGGTLDHNPADIPPSVFCDPTTTGWEYTLQLSDRGRFIINQIIPNESICQDLYIYVPRNDDVAFPVGSVITLINSNNDTNSIYVRPIDFGDQECAKIWAPGFSGPSQWRFPGIQTATLMKISSNGWLLNVNNVFDDD